MPPPTPLTSWTYMKPFLGLAMGVGASTVPRLMTGKVLNRFPSSLATDLFKGAYGAGTNYVDMPNLLYRDLKADPGAFHQKAYGLLSASGGFLDSVFKHQQSSSSPDRQLYMCGEASDAGHADIAVSINGPNPNGPVAKGEELQHLTDIMANFPGGGGRIPDEGEVEYSRAADPSNPNANSDSAAVLRKYLPLATEIPQFYNKPMDALYRLGGSSVRITGHTFQWLADGTLISCAVALTTSQHVLDGARQLMFIQRPDGTRLFLTAGVGQHPISYGDYMNTELSCWVFSAAADTAAVQRDIMPQMIQQFGEEVARQGPFGPVYWEVNKELISRGRWDVIINSSWISLGDLMAGGTLALARSSMPNMTAHFDVDSLAPLLQADAVDVAKAIAIQAEDEGIMPPNDASQLPGPPGPNDPLHEHPEVVSVGQHLPPVSDDPSHYDPTDPDHHYIPSDGSIVDPLSPAAGPDPDDADDPYNSYDPNPEPESDPDPEDPNDDPPVDPEGDPSKSRAG